MNIPQDIINKASIIELGTISTEISTDDLLVYNLYLEKPNVITYSKYLLKHQKKLKIPQNVINEARIIDIGWYNSGWTNYREYLADSRRRPNNHREDLGCEVWNSKFDFILNINSSQSSLQVFHYQFTI